jgi:hypothetical protein
MVTLDYWPCLAVRDLIFLRMYKYQQPELTVAEQTLLKARPLKILSQYKSCLPALIRQLSWSKTPIRASTLVFGLCGSNAADSICLLGLNEIK